MPRFSRAELESFRDAEVPDLLGPDLRLLFVGINPGLWTAATSTHFAHPGQPLLPGPAGGRDPRAPHRPGRRDDRRRPRPPARPGHRHHQPRPPGHRPRRRAHAATSCARARARARRPSSTRARVRGSSPSPGSRPTGRRSACRGPSSGSSPRPSAAPRLWVVPNPSGLNAHHTVGHAGAGLRRAGAGRGGARPEPEVARHPDHGPSSSARSRARLDLPLEHLGRSPPSAPPAPARARAAPPCRRPVRPLEELRQQEPQPRPGRHHRAPPGEVEAAPGGARHPGARPGRLAAARSGPPGAGRSRPAPSWSCTGWGPKPARNTTSSGEQRRRHPQPGSPRHRVRVGAVVVAVVVAGMAVHGISSGTSGRAGRVPPRGDAPTIEIRRLWKPDPCGPRAARTPAGLWVLRARSGATGQAGRVAPSENASADAPPSPPVHRAPGRRPTDDRSTDDQPVREAVRQYAALQPTLVPVTARFVELIRTLLDDAGINYLSVDGRTKSVASFAAKAPAPSTGGCSTPTRWSQITDQVGRAGHHLRARRRGRRRGPARRRAADARRPRPGRRRPHARAASATPAGTCCDPRRARARVVRRPGPAPRQRAGAHGAAARVGRVRARHPLQGHGPGRARPRPRPPLHPRRRAARARRPRVLRDPRAPPGRRPPPAARRTPATRGSARRSWRPSWPASTPTPAGRTPTTTAGSPACSSSWASRPSTSSPRC